MLPPLPMAGEQMMAPSVAYFHSNAPGDWPKEVPIPNNSETLIAKMSLCFIEGSILGACRSANLVDIVSFLNREASNYQNLTPAAPKSCLLLARTAFARYSISR